VARYRSQTQVPPSDAEDDDEDEDEDEMDEGGDEDYGSSDEEVDEIDEGDGSEDGNLGGAAGGDGLNTLRTLVDGGPKDGDVESMELVPVGGSAVDEAADEADDEDDECPLLVEAPAQTTRTTAVTTAVLASAPAILRLSEEDQLMFMRGGWERLVVAITARVQVAAAAVERLEPGGTVVSQATPSEQWQFGAVRHLWQSERALLQDLLARLEAEE
jgi:hypothetical protein